MRSRSVTLARRATKIERPDDADVEILPISQFEIVEGLIAEGIKSIKESLDVLFFNPTDMDPTLNALATRAIALSETESLSAALTAGQIGMHKKHKMCIPILNEMKRRLEANAPDGDKIGDMDLGVFGQDIVDFLTSMHKVMSDGTSDKKRHTYQRAFVEGRKVPKVQHTDS
mgnify:FL=1